MKKQEPSGPRALDLVEEAVFLLRRAPVGAWLCYFIGVLPFVMGLLFFWADMSRNPMAPQHASAAALGLALLFVWKQCGQSFFAARLRSHLLDQPAPHWSGTGLWRLVLHQATWQPTGLVVLPLALLATVPFGWAFAFYQNLTVLGHSDDHPNPKGRPRAGQLARLWPKQNHLIVLTLTLLGLAVFLNILTVLAWGPMLLKMLTGIETPFSRSAYAFLNSTFLMVCLLLTYIVIDPLVKAIYVLRCFYGESIQNGMDLRLRLPVRALLLGLVMAVGLGAGIPATAQETSVAPESLDIALDEVMAQPEFSWRLPRDTLLAEDKEIGWIEGFFKWVDQKIVRPIKEWIRQWFRKWDRARSIKDGGSEWRGFSMDGLVYILVGVLVVVVLYYCIRALRTYHVPPESGASAVAAGVTPDLTNEEVSAADLPRDEWLVLVEQLMGQGEYRLALRACFLAQLAQLADLGHIALARFKTNRDYEHELARRAHVLPVLYDGFCTNRRLFEAVWYGDRDIDRERILAFRQRFQQAGGSAL